MTMDEMEAREQARRREVEHAHSMYIQDLSNLLYECRAFSRENGWDGEDRDYIYTAEDLDYVTDQLSDYGMPKPTEADWYEAGIHGVVGLDHCREEE